MKFFKLYPFIFILLYSCTHAPEENQIKTLDANWTFRNSTDSNFYPAQIPGNIHGDLMRNGLIDNPFYGTNEKKVQWIEKTDWVYVGQFKLSKEDIKYNHIDIEFKGLDTYAEVFLNHHKIISAENMFLAYQKEIKTYLIKGNNLLEVRFKSPINSAMPLWKKAGITYPADNDKTKEHLSVFTRKAAYQYGWDWGPKLVTSGIWQPVLLHFWNDVKLMDIHIIQKNISQKNAKIKIDYEIVAAKKMNADLSVWLNEKKYTSKNIQLDSGINYFHIPIEIINPKLWWPNGMGKAYLYEIKSSLVKNGEEISSLNKRVGLRNIEVVNEPDSLGESFYFKINGFNLYIKGANYIPNSSFAGEVNDTVYKEVFYNAKASNINMLRVWGGGYYEKDKFYDLADENGILIWQDFMFACTTYPSDSAFINNVKNEAIYNIKRLRNHPSLALWCGNNEIEVGWKNWGWQQSYGWNDSIQKQMWVDYHKIFKQLLPNQVEKRDSGRFYFSSSPISNWGNKSYFSFGDNHFWGVWWGEMPFDSFNSYVPRFMSEYGFQALPSIKTIAAFADTSEWDINSPTMLSHQKSSIGSSTIQKYMERNYRKPVDFEDFVYLSQVLQAEGMRIGIEAQRRHKPFNMGSLYWQFNDVWPGISWSGIDYYGRWKALQYIVKKAYSPVILSAIHENDSLQINVISDLLHNQKVNIDLKIITFDGAIIWSKSEEIALQENENHLILKEYLEKLIHHSNLQNIVLIMELNYDSTTLKSCFIFDKPKNLALQKPEIKIYSKATEEGYLINIRSNTFVKNLELSTKANGKWSDNYFDLLPNVNKILLFETKEKPISFIKSIALNSVWGKINTVRPSPLAKGD